MRITRLSLANFRVFPEVELELPAGVVGIYGPNGAGKSTLVEAVMWALFGEQKQVDAFSSRRPEDRRRLVLDLLGISPLDRARDTARGRARALADQVGAARLMLDDLQVLAAEATALEERKAVATAERLVA